DIILKGIGEDKIAVLCSLNNSDKVSKYYNELDDVVYPKQINFITSAYYTGYDIEETYHLICVSDVKKFTTLLSTSQIKQIAGRCREESLLSETFVYNSFTKLSKLPNVIYVTKKGLQE